ncbi:MAG: hypothetical protein LBB53_00065 [Prevotellaceae bacterium]|jgi:hypothetical protein|nr:hypothetical protein [Prevotellaceae bacterium]
MYKTYLYKQPLSRFSTCFEINGKTKFVTFASVGQNAEPVFSTDDGSLQSALENSKFFKSGIVEVQSTSAEAGDDTAIQIGSDKAEGNSYAVFDNVTTFAQAKIILTGEPYNVPKTDAAFSEPEKILEKAEELNVKFPKLILKIKK